MTATAHERHGPPPLARVPDWLRRAGTASWLTLGIVTLVVVAYLGLAAISALVVPLVIAVVIGMIFHPIVDRLQGMGVPRMLGAAVVLVGWRRWRESRSGCRSRACLISRS